MTEFRFSIHGKPVPYVRMTQRSKHVSAQAQRYLVYKDAIGWRAKECGAEIMRGPLALSVEAFVPERRWDLDNLVKGVSDALNHICWEDDKQIVEIRASVRESGGSYTVYVGVESRPGSAWAMSR